MNRHGQTVCLCMIVRDEASVIRRCLDSVRPLLDSWLVVDTGSTDGTQDVVREHLADLPGQLIERPWIDFAHNRTEALEYARGGADYTFVIDADEVLELTEGFELPLLEADSYAAEMNYGGCTYLRRVLVRSALAWRYVGVVHEYIDCPDSKNEGFLTGMQVVPHRDGARARDPNTYRRDALAIEQALIEDPEDSRYVFYLAQSYRDAGDYELALRNYRRRVEMGGWPEEVWYSLYQIAQLQERMGQPWPEVMEEYLRAHEMFPDRAGPLFRIGLHYQGEGRYQLSNLFLGRAAQTPCPSSNRLFVERSLYEYAIAMEHGVSCYYVGDHAGAISTANALLRSSALPAELVEQVVANRRYSLAALAGEGRPALPVMPRLTAVIPFRDPGAELDECVEGLTCQEGVAIRCVFVDLGSQTDHASRLPLERDGCTLRTGLARMTADEAVREVSAKLPPDEVVLALTACERLLPPDAVRTISDAFSDTECLLLYGGHRDANGRLVPAEPAESAAVHASRGASLASSSPLFFRARLAARDTSRSLREAVWHAAGFTGTRFSDDGLTEETAHIPGAAQHETAQTPVTGQHEQHSAARQRGAAGRQAHEATPIGGGPLVSCLMVTRDRLALAKRAIRSFAGQTYAPRELVIVTDGDARFRGALERHVGELGIESVRFVYPDTPDLPLGALRNLSLDEARGEVMCQWDDDDYSHPERIARQLAALREQDGAACLLTDHLQLHERERVVLWVDWTDGGRITGLDRLAPGTLMLARDPSLRYPETGDYAERGEDSVLLAAVAERGPIAHLEGEGHLWLYTYHGRNTFSAEHHRHLSKFGKPRDAVLQRADIIKAALDHYPIPRPATVAGRDGAAFAVR
jgi:glycosyltransferase involved in cell wall biosynthesis